MTLLSLAILLFGGALCLVFARRWPLWVNRLGGAVSVAAALPAVVAAGRVLWTGRGESFYLPWRVPFGSFSIALDGLSAFFMLAIALICGLAAIYGVAYLKGHAHRERLGSCWFFYHLLFASMLLAVTARNGLLFLVAWEGMSLCSFFLVLFEHERQEARDAGWTYLVAMHLGTAFLFVLFVLLGWREQSMDFDLATVPSGGASVGILFLLAAIGFGTKAGFMPMHVWLPAAYPAAPSHVSAVMSGVMSKTGVYGLLRVLTMLGPPSHWPSWWGWLLIGAGAFAGLGGILLALAQRDIKRLLAYSSVENIGIIGLGLGLWLVGTSSGAPALATLGLLGALLHVWNHALFKSLLFLGVGAVVHATGTRDLERMGGLLKRMRFTGTFVFVGAAAICGLPPFLGFVGEFLLYAGAFSGMAGQGGVEGAVAGLVVVGALAMIGGLTLACFARFFGIAFLGQSRAEDAAPVHEAPRLMLAPMAVLAGCCLLPVFLGPWILRALWPWTSSLLPPPVKALSDVAGWDVVDLLRCVRAVSLLLLAVAAGFGVVRQYLLAGRVVELAGTWDCGYAAPNARMQYTASSFASPILDMFRLLLRPRMQRRLPAGLFPRQASFASQTEDPCLRYGYVPLFRGFSRVADRLRRVQQGMNQLYVLYIALALLLLLLWKLGLA